MRFEGHLQLQLRTREDRIRKRWTIDIRNILLKELLVFRELSESGQPGLVTIVGVSGRSGRDASQVVPRSAPVGLGEDQTAPAVTFTYRRPWKVKVKYVYCIHE